ncbi:S8 family serine peptidase [Nannocystis pusilla]|uniref:S8 family serine peptidase n=1 Tax=Nannocystis pusilla TaxID=889268 RepID=UPI003DA5BCD0
MNNPHTSSIHAPLSQSRRLQRALCVLGLTLAGCEAEPDEFGDTDDFVDAEVEERALGVTPSDPLFSLQKWHYEAARVPEAWTLSKGSTGVLIAVADSGRLSHPELNGKWTTGYDFFGGNVDPFDQGDYHHGIHVAGTLGAASNNGSGGAGICWHCPLMPLRVAQAYGSANVSDPGMVESFPTIAARAIRYAAGLPTPNGRGQTVQSSKRANVVNISVGNVAGPCPAALKSAIDAAAAAGTVVVAAAGNGDSGYEYGPVPDFNPAHYLWTTCNSSNLIVVAAVDAAGKAEPYSLTGSGVTIAAPGGSAVNGLAGHGAVIGCQQMTDTGTTGTSGVVSTWLPFGQNTSACHRHWAGTSMAAPHVSGVVALMRSRNPALSVAQIKSILEKTAKKSIPCGAACGAGMLDAYKAASGATFGMTVHCESTGGGSFFCSPVITGGVGPFTAAWTGVQNVTISPNSMDPSLLTGSCKVNASARVRGTFTDAIGRTVVHERTFNCTQVAP